MPTTGVEAKVPRHSGILEKWPPRSNGILKRSKSSREVATKFCLNPSKTDQDSSMLKPPLSLFRGIVQELSASAESNVENGQLASSIGLVRLL